MAYAISDVRTISAQTTADLSGSQFRFVTLKTDMTVDVCGATGMALGILENQPSAPILSTYGSTGVSGYVAGQYACTVSVDGVTRVEVNTALPVGTIVGPSIANDGVAAGIGATGSYGYYYFSRAILLQPSTAAGDVVACKLLGPAMGSPAA
jgi:hypothetical protein